MAWRLTIVRPLKKIESPSDLITQWSTELETKEVAHGIGNGQPILLPESDRPDIDVILYLNSGSFRRLSKQTQISYAKDLKLFFNFLDSQNKNWRDASEDDLYDYEFWRRRDKDNISRVSGAKFARELSSIDRFYEWQVTKNLLAKSPIKRTDLRTRDGGTSTSIALMPRNIRNTNVKWLTARAYRQWRDVGLAGYTIDGLRDAKWRGRTDGRNVAFADLLWSTGLRLSEGATLLTLELPDQGRGERYERGRLGESVAKWGSKRDFWIPRLVLDRIDNYVKIDRNHAIQRARSEGRYENIKDIIIATKVSANRVLHHESVEGGSGQIPLDRLDADMRRVIFIRNGSLLEPAHLWLNESGLPMPVDTWESIFKLANNRCKKFGSHIYCHPHMLRHSFALKMLVTFMHLFDRRLNITPEERKEFRMLFGDPWVLVQHLLGHSNPEVTRDVYLEPVKGIQLDLFLNDKVTGDSSVDELLNRIAAQSEQVADVWTGSRS